MKIEIHEARNGWIVMVNPGECGNTTLVAETHEILLHLIKEWTLGRGPSAHTDGEEVAEEPPRACKDLE